MQKSRSRKDNRTGPFEWRRLWERALRPIANHFRPEPPKAKRMPVNGRKAALPQGPRKKVALALQGGGVHGAFTWGVLDRMLEEGRLDFEAVSGTSAGAVNAVVLAAGLAEGGPARAQERLQELWEGVAAIGNFSPFRPTPMERMASNWNADWSSGTLALEFLTRMFSPYQMNPLAINPLRQLIERIVDFERVRASPLKLFVSATNLRTGRPRVFKTAEMSADAVLASACLPSLNQPVEIAGEHYWDGGFTANPAILPLVAECETHDIMIVRITPASETELPVTARDIHGRLNRIVFNAPLHREMQTIAWMQDMVGASGADCGPLGQKLSRLRLHHIDGDEVMRPLGAASAMHADWSLISHLHDHGRMRSGDWLENNWRAIAVQPVAAE